MAEHKKTLFACFKCGSQQLRTAGARKCIDCRTGRIFPVLAIEAKIKTDADGLGFSGTFKLTDAGLEALKNKPAFLNMRIKPQC